MTHLSENTEIRTKMTDRPLPEKTCEGQANKFFLWGLMANKIVITWNMTLIDAQ